MKTNLFTNKVMSKVAESENGRLIKTLIATSPFLLFFTSVFAYYLYETIAEISDQGILGLLFTVEYDWKTLLPQIQELSSFFWESFEKELFIVLFISLILIAWLIKRSNISSFPQRFREIYKYLR